MSSSSIHAPTLNELHVLVQQGEGMLPGDEVWDSDFEHWELIQQINFQRKVGAKDVVRRKVFDLKPLVKQLLTQLEKLRGHPDITADYWQETDSILAEAKRRLGMRSFESFDDTGLCKPAAVQAEPEKIGNGLRDEVQEFRRRNRM